MRVLTVKKRESKRNMNFPIVWRSLAILCFVVPQFANASDSSTPSVENASLWRIEKVHIDCVERNLSEYLAVSSSRVVIVLPACPVVDFTKALEQLAQANLMAREDQIGSSRTIISLSREELECLIEIAKKTDGDVLEVNSEQLCG